MKIMVINSKAGNTMPQDMDVKLMADSTFLRNRQPFFIPDFAPSFAALPVMALRIGRLGKCVAQRFAHRYVDAIAPAFIVMPMDDDMQPLQCHGMAQAIDGSLLMGEWTPVSTTAALPAIEWEACGKTGTVTMGPHMPLPDAVIAQLTQYCTIKMGDIVCLHDDRQQPVKLAIDTRVTAEVNGTRVLEHKIK
ncbi:MAG: hypothetical protein MJZ74_02670 [Muribaculaceae bacterium]|nr:hypothetical protein [Muribaculaceae bacterium]